MALLFVVCLQGEKVTVDGNPFTSDEDIEEAEFKSLAMLSLQFLKIGVLVHTDCLLASHQCSSDEPFLLVFPLC